MSLPSGAYSVHEKTVDGKRVLSPIVLPPERVPSRRGKWRSRNRERIELLPFRCNLLDRRWISQSVHAQVHGHGQSYDWGGLEV